MYIFRRQIEEIRHRRKLLAFLVLLPVLLMVLVGVAFGNRTVPESLPDSDPSTIQQLRNDTALMTVLNILAREGDNSTGTGPVRILAASADSPTSPGSKVLVYVIPSTDQTSVVFVEKGTGFYYYLGFANDFSSVKTAKGSAPVPSGLETLPEIDLQSLYSSETAVRLAKTGATIFQLGLQLAPLNERRLLDVLFPELVGIQMAWVGVLGAAVTAVEDRTAGARKRTLMTPVPRASFVLGNAMASFFLIGLQLIILFSTAIGVFHVTIAGTIFDLIPVIVASSFSVIGIGLIISHFSKTADEAFYLSTVVNLPMGILGSSLLAYGGRLDIEVSNFFPMTYANRALELIMVNGQSLAAAMPDLLGLASFAVVLYPIGVFLLSRER